MIYNQWYAILPSRAVREARPVGVRRCNIDLVLFRDPNGKVACLHDRCSHRGAALHKGTVKDGCVKCPFHGIEFDQNGACHFVPALGKQSSEDLSRFDVEHFVVEEAHDIIYLWDGDREAKKPALPFFDDDIDERFVYSELEDHWHAHYSRAIENQLDVVHLPFVHHNTIGRGNKTLVNGPKVLFKGDILRTSADNEVDRGQKPKDANAARIRKTHLNFLFPNLWLNHISEKVRVLIFFAPVDDENTVLYIRFYNRITGIRPIDGLIAFFGRYANLIVERQDKRVVITQEPKASGLKIGEHLIAGDAPIIRYRKIRDDLQKKQQTKA